jgi:hypothetical protein
MQKRLDEGYEPQEPILGPNLWRIFSGDRIVWVGPSRSGIKSEKGVLDLVDFRENALVYGEPFDSTGEIPWFGGCDKGEPSPEGIKLCRAGWEVLKQLKPPRTVAADGQWRIG